MKDVIIRREKCQKYVMPFIPMLCPKNTNKIKIIFDIILEIIFVVKAQKLIKKFFF